MPTGFHTLQANEVLQFYQRDVRYGAIEVYKVISILWSLPLTVRPVHGTLYCGGVGPRGNSRRPGCHPLVMRQSLCLCQVSQDKQILPTARDQARLNLRSQRTIIERLVVRNL